MENCKQNLGRPGKWKTIALEETSEKQTPEAVLQKSYSDKFEEIPMKTPTIVCDFFLENFPNILE